MIFMNTGVLRITCVFQACRDKGVDCIVAPYEADAQLAFLNQSGIADIIVTEDSDLVLFGCDRVMSMINLHHSWIMREYFIWMPQH